MTQPGGAHRRPTWANTWGQCGSGPARARAAAPARCTCAGQRLRRRWPLPSAASARGAQLGRDARSGARTRLCLALWCLNLVLPQEEQSSDLTPQRLAMVVDAARNPQGKYEMFNRVFCRGQSRAIWTQYLPRPNATVLIVTLDHSFPIPAS